MEIRFARATTSIDPRYTAFLCRSLSLLCRTTAKLARPIPALRFIAATAAIGLFATLPARALITPTAPVGATAGSFAVSSSGAATYTIPIFVPPGTNGLQPSLALAYNSQGGDGFLGLGWSLSGLSVIHRCGATKEIDGQNGGVNYDADDKFCLDGERLLRMAGNEYRTERESLQKVIASDGTTNPASFTVHDKDGSKRHYGLTEDSRIQAAPPRADIVRLWALNKIEDVHGNYLQIQYQEVNADGEYFPVMISYTGNSAAGIAPQSSVQFDYGYHAAGTVGYEGGAAIKNTRRLYLIRSCAGLTCVEGSTLVRAYHLTYDSDGAAGRSRLTSVQECGTDNACLPATTFAWQNNLPPGSFQPGPSSSIGSGGDVTDRFFTTADVNGDGKEDAVKWELPSGNVQVWYSTGTGLQSGPTQYLGSGGTTSNRWFVVADVNGDGKADPIKFEAPSGYVSAWISTSTGFQSGPSHYIGSGGDDKDRFFTVADVDGDGRADAVKYELPSGYVSVWLSTGTAFTSGPSQYIGSGGETSNRWFTMADVNGDGKADAVKFEAGSGYVSAWISTATGFQPGPSYYIGSGGDKKDRTFMMADVNGDGKADAIKYELNTGYVGVWFSSGTSFVPGPIYYIGSGGTTETRWFTVGDINGDGRADVTKYERSSGLASVWLSTGSSFQTGPTHYIGSGGTTENRWFELTDFNGDGKADVVKYEPASGNVGIWLHEGPLPDLLLTTTAGSGAWTSVSYKSLTDASVYTKDTETLNYPYQHVQVPQYAVYDVRAANGIGGYNTTTYQYAGLKRHLTADTSLGFHRIQATDPASLVNVTHNNQNRDLGIDGTVAIQETFASGIRVKYVSNNWERATGVCGGTSQPQLRSSVEETRELNNSIVTTVNTSTNYDWCGFPTNTIANYNDGWRKTVTNTYSHDTSSWRLGRLTRAEVTAEAPGSSPQTRVSAFSYNGAGLIAGEVIEPDQPALTLTTTYTYDAFGNRTGKTVSGPDIVSRSESQSYDPTGRFVISRTNALGHISTFEHDPRNGQPTRRTDPNGLNTTWDYDGLGRKGLEVRPDGTHSIITYSTTASGYSTRVQSAGSGEASTFFDILGREVQSKIQGFGGRWIYRSVRYDALGRVIFKSQPEFNAPSIYETSYDYDVVGRLTSVTEPGPGNRTTTTSYSGFSTTVTNPLGQERTAVKNSQGKVVQAIDNAGTTQYQYDPFGNLIQVTDVAGNVSTIHYDIRGRKIAMHDPDMGDWIYGYNVLGELTSQRDAKLQNTTMTYDKLGRMTSRTTPEGVSSWTYDTATKGIGKFASVAGPGGYHQEHSYDSFSRPEHIRTTIGGAVYTASYGYGQFGRLETITYPNTGYTVKQEYDPYGHLLLVKRLQADGTQTLIWQVDDADAHGRIVREIFYNGAISQRAYDPATSDLLTIQTGSGENSANIQNLSYTFDAIDKLLSRGDVIVGLNETFSYDNLNRLTQATGAVTKTYQYDVMGNITSKSDVGTYSYNASGPNSVRPHAVTATAGILNSTYTYDANGNMLTGAGRTISYTSFNKPQSITSNGQTTTFAYDPNHNRIQKVAGAKTTVYIGKLYENVTTGTLVEHKNYIYAGNSLVATYTERNNSTPAETRYIHTDHLGSTNVITDDNAAVLERLSFDPHGKRRQVNGHDATGPVGSSINRGFTRHEHDDEVGLINMNARLYDPVLGRFITPDSVIDGPTSQGLNRYSYVLNSPLSLTDPTGQWSLRKSLKRLTKNIKRVANKWGRTIVAAVAAYYTFNFAYDSLFWSASETGLYVSNPVLAGVGGGAAGGATFGATSTALQGGNSRDVLRAGFRGGVAGAFSGGISAYDFGPVYSDGSIAWGNAAIRVGARAITSGVVSEINGGSFRNGFEQGGITAGFSVGAEAMRTAMEQQSLLRGTNSSGSSGWGLKLGGCREGSTGWCLGGVQQAGGGYVFAKVTGWNEGVPSYGATFIPYQNGGFWDGLIESFAGAHDYLNSRHYYHPNGTGGLAGGEGWNVLNVGLAMPFAAAGAVSHYFPGGDVFVGGRH